MLRKVFKGLFNRCAVCGESCEPEMLQDMGKYVMCITCLKKEKEELKRKQETGTPEKSGGLFI